MANGPMHMISVNLQMVLLLIEQTRAIGLRDAIKQAAGVPVVGGLVAPEALQELEEELEAAKQST